MIWWVLFSPAQNPHFLRTCSSNTDVLMVSLVSMDQMIDVPEEEKSNQEHWSKASRLAEAYTLEQSIRTMGASSCRPTTVTTRPPRPCVLVSGYAIFPGRTPLQKAASKSRNLLSERDLISKREKKIVDRSMVRPLLQKSSTSWLSLSKWVNSGVISSQRDVCALHTRELSPRQTERTFMALSHHILVSVILRYLAVEQAPAASRTWSS